MAVCMFTILQRIGNMIGCNREKIGGLTMDQIKHKKVENIVNIHEFYCDGCGGYLGKSEEYDDGYYPNPYNFNLSLNTTQWFRIRRDFCPECKEKFLSKLNDFLQECGFKKEK